MIELSNGLGPHGGRTGETLPISDTVNSRAVTSGNAESITIPSAAKFVVLKCTVDFYANWTTTATVPADVTDGTASELNPHIRRITGGETLSIITAANGVITAAFYN